MRVIFHRLHPTGKKTFCGIRTPVRVTCHLSQVTCKRCQGRRKSPGTFFENLEQGLNEALAYAKGRTKRPEG